MLKPSPRCPSTILCEQAIQEHAIKLFFRVNLAKWIKLTLFLHKQLVYQTAFFIFLN